MNKDNNTTEQAAVSSGKPFYIVTGATGAMGKVICKRLASISLF